MDVPAVLVAAHGLTSVRVRVTGDDHILVWTAGTPNDVKAARHCVPIAAFPAVLDATRVLLVAYDDTLPDSSCWTPVNEPRFPPPLCYPLWTTGTPVCVLHVGEHVGGFCYGQPLSNTPPARPLQISDLIRLEFPDYGTPTAAVAITRASAAALRSVSLTQTEDSASVKQRALHADEYLEEKPEDGAPGEESEEEQEEQEEGEDDTGEHEEEEEGDDDEMEECDEERGDASVTTRHADVADAISRKDPDGEEDDEEDAYEDAIMSEDEDAADCAFVVDDCEEEDMLNNDGNSEAASLEVDEDD